MSGKQQSARSLVTATGRSASCAILSVVRTDPHWATLGEDLLDALPHRFLIQSTAKALLVPTLTPHSEPQL
jgi:hypothetical protein